MLKSAGIKREDAAANKDAVMEVLNFQMQYQKQRAANQQTDNAGAAGGGATNWPTGPGWEATPGASATAHAADKPADSATAAPSSGGLPTQKVITLEELVNTSIDPIQAYSQSRKLGEGYE